MLKFKIYDTKNKEFLQNTTYSISAADGGVLICDKPGGSIYNRHLIPLQFAEKKDHKGKEIYDKYIVKRIGETSDKDITGIVERVEGEWRIVDHKNKLYVPLFSGGIDEVIGVSNII